MLDLRFGALDLLGSALELRWGALDLRCGALDLHWSALDSSWGALGVRWRRNLYIHVCALSSGKHLNLSTCDSEANRDRALFYS